MGTTSEKLSYLNETKGKIKRAINNFGGKLTNDSTFRSYPDELYNAWDNIFNQLPHVEDTSTSPSLSSTLEAPMRNNLKGNTSQTGTPTPTSPIPVNVVSGDNEILVNGKNLFDKSSALLNKMAQGNGNIIDYTGIFSSDYIKVQPSTSYYVNQYAPVPIEYDKNKNVIGYSTGGNSGYAKTFTTSSNCQYLRIRMFDTTYSMDTALNNAMLSLGTTAPTTYEPYQGNTYNIDLPVENLFDKNSPNIVNGYLNANGDITSNNSYRVSDYIYIGNYSYITMSGNAGGSEVYCFYDSSKTFAGANSMGSNTSKTISVPSGTSYIRATINANNIDTYMVEKGQKINSYAPYGSAIELCKIGDYQDRIIYTDGRNLVQMGLTTETYNSLTITNQNNGLVTFSGTPTSSFGRNIMSNFTLPKGTYTISANNIPDGMYISIDEITSTMLDKNNFSKTFTISEDTTYNNLAIWLTKNKAYNFTLELQLEKGNKSLWQPYGSGSWYKLKKVGKKTLIASDVNSRGATGTNAYYLATKVTSLNDNTIALCMTSMFNSVSFNNRADGNYNIYSQNGTISLRTGDNTSIDWSTLENAKQWVTDNEPIVYYVLETPTLETITDEPLINQLKEIYNAKSKNGQTNISQVNNDLPFIINATALLDANTYIMQLEAELEASS